MVTVLPQTPFPYYLGDAFTYHGTVMLVIDSQTGEILHANQAAHRFYGYPEEQLLDMTIYDINTLSRESLRQEIRSAPAEQRNTFSFSHQLSSGEIRFVEVSSRPIENEQTALFSVIHDKTPRVEALSELEEYTKRLERAEQIAHMGHWEFHLDENLVKASEGAKHIYGVFEGPAAIEQVQQYALEEYRGLLDRSLKALIEEGEPYDLTYRIRNASDGEIRTVRSAAEYDPESSIVFGTVYDITEYQEALELLEEQHSRFTYTLIGFFVLLAAGLIFLLHLLKKARTASRSLRNSEENYRKLFYANPNPMCIFDISTKKCIEVNQAVQALYGFTREDFLAMTFTELKPAPENQRMLEEVVSIQPGLSIAGEMVHRKKDGTKINTEISFHTLEWKGENACLALIRDITDRKQAVEELKESRQLLQNVLDAIPVRVFWKSTDLTYMGCNLPFAQDAGFSHPDELIGKDDYQMGWKENAESYRKDDLEVMQSGKSKLHYEETQATPEGGIRMLQTSKVPLRNTRGEIIGMLGTYEDITERKRSEQQKHQLHEQLMHAQKMESIGRLAGGVAHDFNNMLGVILGHTELLIDELPEGSEHFQSLREIEYAARRSAMLTQQLTAYARKQTVNPKVLNLNETVEGLLTMLDRLVGEEIDLIWEPGSELPTVSMDLSQVNQMLMNLVVNAKDAYSGKGEITIRTAYVSLDVSFCREHPELSPGSYVMLSVIDSASGMDEHTRNNIFEPFFTTKEVGKGTGLGLSMVYGAVEQNGGFIQVESQEGKGTAISIYLPPAAEETELFQEAVQAEFPELATEGYTILFVEGDPLIKRMGVDVLVRQGYTVLSEHDPKKALEIIRSCPEDIDLLITDMIMPGMDGAELIVQAKELRPSLLMLCISGYTENTLVHQGIAEADVAFLRKPFSIKTLEGKVRELLHFRRH